MKILISLILLSLLSTLASPLFAHVLTPAATPPLLTKRVAASRPTHPPSLSKVVSVAIDAAALPDLSPLKSRSRLRALMPRIGAWVGQNLDDTFDHSSRDIVERDTAGALGLKRTQNDANTRKNGRITWKVTVTFNLEPLLYDTSEIHLLREERAQRKEIQDLTTQIEDLYRTWVFHPTAAEQRIAFQRLIVLTDGWISPYRKTVTYHEE